MISTASNELCKGNTLQSMSYLSLVRKMSILIINLGFLKMPFCILKIWVQLLLLMYWYIKVGCKVAYGLGVINVIFEFWECLKSTFHILSNKIFWWFSVNLLWITFPSTWLEFHLRAWMFSKDEREKNRLKKVDKLQIEFMKR